jgi:hypothetical protein
MVSQSPLTATKGSSSSRTAGVCRCTARAWPSTRHATANNATKEQLPLSEGGASHTLIS